MTDTMKLFLLDRQNILLKTENEKLKANLDYVAMMTEVDIPEDEGGGENE